jgi:phosphoglycerate dehydrogenase-like enzyme
MKILLGWGLTEEQNDDLRRRFPDQRIVELDTGEPPGPQVADAEVYTPGKLDADVLAAAGKLRWVHFCHAGLDSSLFPELVQSDLLLTNSADVFSEPMGEHALGLILSFSRGLNFCRARYANWNERCNRMDATGREVKGATLGVVGYGGIGRAAARRAHALGMRVLAVAGSEHETDGIAEWIRGPEALPELLEASDYVVVSCPLTEQTRHIIGPEQIARMRPNAVLVNLGRGALVDQEALLEALRDQRIGGAGLDVTTPEPLPDDHPFWSMDNVIITPHCAAASPRTPGRVYEMFAENLRRYLAGEPMLNVVDKQAGY